MIAALRLPAPLAALLGDDQQRAPGMMRDGDRAQPVDAVVAAGVRDR
jgi:hypothetical protein